MVYLCNPWLKNGRIILPHFRRLIFGGILFPVEDEAGVVGGIEFYPVGGRVVVE